MLLHIVCIFLFLFLALVSEVRISPDVLLEHPVPSACLVPSDSFSLSTDNMATAIQTTSNPRNPSVLEEQVKLQFLCFSMGTYCIKYLSTVSFLSKFRPNFLLRAKGPWISVVQTSK